MYAIIEDGARQYRAEEGKLLKLDYRDVKAGDTLELMIKGSAFLPSEISSLSVRVTPLDMGPANLTYVSAGRLDATLRIPPNAPTGVYGVNVLSNGKALQEQINVSGIVPPNWLAGVKLATPLAPGKNGQLLILGRDIAPEFVKALTLETDTDGIKLSNLRWQDPMTLVADIAVATEVAPGDYLIHVLEGGKPLKLPRGNIIKVTP